MGLILDSSLLIAGERRGQCVWDILERAKASQGETENALCAITVVELIHGIYRAKSEVDQSNHAARSEYRLFLPLCQNADMRRRFTDECCQRTQPRGDYPGHK